MFLADNFGMFHWELSSMNFHLPWEKTPHVLNPVFSLLVKNNITKLPRTELMTIYIQQDIVLNTSSLNKRRQKCMGIQF